MCMDSMYMMIWHKIYFYFDIMTADDPVTCGNRTLTNKTLIAQYICIIVFFYIYISFLEATKDIC